MSEVLVGKAYGIMELRYEQFSKGVSAVEQQLLRLQKLAAQPIVVPAPQLPTTTPRSGGGSAPDPVAQQAKIERAILARANAMARLVQVENTGANTTIGLAKAADIYRQALTRVDRTSIEAIRVQTQLAAVQNRLKNIQGGGLPVLPRTLESFGPQALAQMKSGLLGIAGTLGLVTTAAGVLAEALQNAEKGFELRGQLTETRQTLGLLFDDVDRGNKVFDKAIAFGRRYGFTQEEIKDAVQGVQQVIRTSTTDTQKQFEVTARLLQLNKAEDFAGAGRAIAELQAGQIQSIVTRFNLSRTAANQLNQEVKEGKDVFLALDGALNRMNITTETLELRTQGAAGALRTYKQAQEDLSLAMGQFAEGPGKDVLLILTDITRAAATGNPFAAASGGENQAQSSFVTQAKDYTTYTQQVVDANQKVREELQRTIPILSRLIPGFTEALFLYSELHGELPTLTKAQFEYARSLVAVGVPQGQAVVRAQALSQQQEILNRYTEAATRNNFAQGEAYAALQPQLLAVAALGADGEQKVQALSQTFITGGVSAAQLSAALNTLIQDAAADRIETEHLTRSHHALNQVIETTASKSIEDAIAKRKESTETALLQAKVDAAAASFKKLHPQMDATGLAAIVAASNIDPLIKQLLLAQYEADEAAKALAGFQAAANQKIINQQEELDLRRSGGRMDPNDLKRQQEYNAGQAAITAAKARSDAAAAGREAIEQLGTYRQQLALLQADLAKLTPGTGAYIRKQTEITALKNAQAAKDAVEAEKAGNKAEQAAEKARRTAEQINEARRDLLTDEQRLAEDKRLLAGKLPELRRLELMKEVEDLEHKISEEREKQADEAERARAAIIDARLNIIEDRRAQREEAKKARKAMKILNSTSANADQRANAADILEEIPLRQEKRRQEIEKQLREAGVSGTAGGALPPLPGTSGLPALPGLPRGGALAPLPGRPAGAAGVGMLPASAYAPNITIGLTVLLDGRQIAAQLQATSNTGTIGRLRVALDNVISGGTPFRSQ